VLSGEFQVVNHHLLRDLIERNLWNDEIKNAIIACNGSIQRIDIIPDDLKGALHANLASNAVKVNWLIA